MEKTLKKSFIAIITVVLMITVSCKKQTNNKVENDINSMEISAKEEKIVDFLEKYQLMKTGIKVEGEPVSESEAMWYWEVVLNYAHGFVEDYLTNCRTDTVYVNCPNIDEIGMISENDLMQTYSDVFYSVRERYMSLNMDEKTLKFIHINRISDNAKTDNEQLEIIITTGSRNQQPDPGTPGTMYGMPFVDGDDWIWGIKRGACDGNFYNVSDAAMQLTDAVVYYDATHYVNDCPGPNYHYWIDVVVDSTYYPSLYTGVCDSGSTWLFRKYSATPSDVLSYCLDDDALNCFYTGIMTKTHGNGILSTFPSNNAPYYYLNVFSECPPVNEASEMLIQHKLKIYYAHRGWRLNDYVIVPIDDPIYDN